MDQQNAYGIMLAKLRAHRRTAEVIAQVLQPYNVTVNEWLLLGAVMKQGGSTSSGQLAEELQVTLPLITRLTKQLQESGLLLSEKNKADKRGRIITLTESGQKVLAAAEPVVRDALKAWLAPIDREHIDVYIAVIMQVAYKL